MKPVFARPERRTASAMGGRADTRALWRRLAQAILAVFCLVAAARAGLPAGDATLLVGSVADEATRADASLDQGRKLLRPKAAPIAERVWRAIDRGGAGSDQQATLALLPEREPLPLADRIGFHSNDDRGPAWRSIRAGYARAPPTTSDRSQPFA